MNFLSANNHLLLQQQELHDSLRFHTRRKFHLCNLTNKLHQLQQTLDPSEVQYTVQNMQSLWNSLSFQKDPLSFCNFGLWQYMDSSIMSLFLCLLCSDKYIQAHLRGILCFHRCLNNRLIVVLKIIDLFLQSNMHFKELQLHKMPSKKHTFLDFLLLSPYHLHASRYLVKIQAFLLKPLLKKIQSNLL